MMFETSILTRNRIRLAYAVAITADVLQFGFGPFGWAFVDQFIDVMAMILTVRAIGFHPLLLPTFAVEFVPVIDMLPTWTACVTIVITRRKRQQSPPSAPPPPPSTGPVIDV